MCLMKISVSDILALNYFHLGYFSFYFRLSIFFIIVLILRLMMYNRCLITLSLLWITSWIRIRVSSSILHWVFAQVYIATINMILLLMSSFWIMSIFIRVFLVMILWTLVIIWTLILICFMMPLTLIFLIHRSMLASRIMGRCILLMIIFHKMSIRLIFLMPLITVLIAPTVSIIICWLTYMLIFIIVGELMIIVCSPFFR